LCPNDTSLSNTGAAGNASLGNDTAVVTDLDIMAELDQIIDFYAIPEARTSEAGTVNRRITADFNIIA